MHQTAVQHEESAREQVRHFSVKELCTQEAHRNKEFQLVSVDTLLNWAHTSERLSSLLGQMPLRLREGQTRALACLALIDEEHRASHGGDGENRGG